VVCSFTDRLDQIQRRHLRVVETMAHGLMEMKETAAAKQSSLYDVEGRIQYFLDRFYLMRISIRLLIHQHCESSLQSDFRIYSHRSRVVYNSSPKNESLFGLK